MATRYPFSLIKERLAQLKEKALDFAIGRRSIPLPGDIHSWVQEHAKLALKPSGRADMDEFAEVAAAYLNREYGLDVPPEQILPTSGGRVAMGAFVACVLNPDDAVIVTEPGYPAFARLAAHRHGRVISVPLQPDHNFAPDLGSAAVMEAGPIKLISLNYPNNPTGATLSGEIVDAVAKLVSRDTVVFNDATYAPLVYDEAPASMLGNTRLNQQKVEMLELHSFSKLFPLGPSAVSFVAGSAHTMEQLKTYSEFAWSPLSGLQLKATMMCLKDADRLRELRRFFPPQLDALRDTLAAVGFKPHAVSAGVYVLCDAPTHINGRPVSCAAECAEWLMDEFDLAVVPLDIPGQGYLRFTALYQNDDLQRLAALRGRLRPALVSGNDGDSVVGGPVVG